MEPRRRSYTNLDGRRVDDGPRYAYDGLLGQGPRKAYPRLRRRFSRYFTSGLTFIIVVFILWLIRGSWHADFHVRTRPPPSGPAPWEKFPFLKRYHGGIKTLVHRSANEPEYPPGEAPPPSRRDMVAVKPFNPYEAKAGFAVPRKCFLDVKETVTVPLLLMHQGVPSGFPDPVIGSHDLLGLDSGGCFDRYGRLGQYGLGYMIGGTGADTAGQGRKEAISLVWRDVKPVDYDKIDWGDAQTRCLTKNRDLLKQAGRDEQVKPVTIFGPTEETEQRQHIRRQEDLALRQVPRIAIVVRTWLGYEYDAEDRLYLRSLINEAAIHSGGEYTVHFLVHVKEEDENQLNPWVDHANYEKTLRHALPQEFRGMGTLWSESLMRSIYAGMSETNFRDRPIYGSYRSLYMPMMYFAHHHPEYDHFWHWEMDARYTGNYYHLFDKLGSWAKLQPRKGLWERNGRFYVPSEHGTWVDFSHTVRVQTEQGTSKSRGLEPSVWGPLQPAGNESYTKEDVTPPSTYAADKSSWGVGEDADLITLNPLFDPAETNWILANDVTGYNTSEGMPPRRTAIVTASRLSKRLLRLMHIETAQAKHSMFTEMWPGSVALHHGLKAVYAPHPVYIDRAWPVKYLASVFNNGRNGASGGALSSVFSDERQHNFLGTTWYYHAGFAGNLWKRWMGLRVDNDGGEEAEKEGEGRMCLPAMLLHPVKQVDLDYTQGKEVVR